MKGLAPIASDQMTRNVMAWRNKALHQSRWRCGLGIPFGCSVRRHIACLLLPKHNLPVWGLHTSLFIPRMTSV